MFKWNNSVVRPRKTGARGRKSWRVGPIDAQGTLQTIEHLNRSHGRHAIAELPKLCAFNIHRVFAALHSGWWM